jgi:TolB-like protein/DNA-binding winged helix-turn-helix (wHTH) protein/Tfp pilus assembly protein PilF
MLDEISKDGTNVKLEPRTMRLLVCLAENAGQVLSVEQLLDEVWKDVVVTPNSVYHAVAELRRVLGDDPKEPSYIANVLRRGYRLVAPVSSWVDAPAVPEADSPATTSTETTAPPATAATGSAFLRSGIALIVALALLLAYLAADRFWLSKPVTAEHPATAATRAVADQSIAVLPFIDMSEKKDQEYFADGMAEEIIGLLSKVPDLHVPARTSSFYFKGKQTTIAEIAKALGVAHVLEGSVRKSGNTVRITAQLVRVDNGYQVWSETFDRQLDDIFKIQDEIAGDVVKSLKASLLEGEAPRTTPTTNTEAYTFYLQALSLSKRGNSADSLTAIEYLRQATRMDPQFALAWALSAQLHTDETVDWTQLFKSDYAAVRSDHDAAVANWPKIYAQSCTAGHQAGDKALTLAPKLAEAHMAMALVLLWCDWNWAAADAELRKARELDPGNAQSTQAAADLAITLGLLDDAKQLARRAILQDPLGTAGVELARAAHRTGALDEAQAAYRKVIELYPTFSGAHYNFATVLLARGEREAALAEFEREAAQPFRQVGLPLALDALGRRADADRELGKAEYWANGMAYQITYIYAARKDVDRAFDWLERAYRQHDTGLVWMKGDPLLKNLVPDPRYKAMLQKMKLPE